MSKREPSELEDVLGRALKALDGLGATSALIGGIAVGIWTRPRATKDVDLQVSLPGERRHALDGAMQAEGLTLIVSHADGAIRRYRDADLGVAVDLLLAELPLEEAVVANATTIPFGALRVRVARPEELLALKILALRPSSDDARDARALLRIAPSDLDMQLVRDYLDDFGEDYVARLVELVAELGEP
jgi:hypothetical protein